jgi:hypothetical protein
MDYPEIFEDMARSWGCKKNNILWNECRVSSEMLIDAANKSMEDQDSIFYKALGHLLHIEDVPYSDGDDLKSNSNEEDKSPEGQDESESDDDSDDDQMRAAHRAKRTRGSFVQGPTRK